MNFPDSDLQFIARQLVATREGNQISAADAQRLSNLAQFGDSFERGPGNTTMPEERRSAEKLPDEAGAKDVVEG